MEAQCLYYPECFCGQAERAVCGLRLRRTWTLDGNHKKQPRNGR